MLSAVEASLPRKAIQSNEITAAVEMLHCVQHDVLFLLTSSPHQLGQHLQGGACPRLHRSQRDAELLGGFGLGATAEIE